MKARGVGLVVVGAVLVLMGGPVAGIVLYYGQDSAALAMVAAVAIQTLGAVLIAVGAARRARQPAPPPASN